MLHAKQPSRTSNCIIERRFPTLGGKLFAYGAL